MRTPIHEVGVTTNSTAITPLPAIETYVQRIYGLPAYWDSGVDQQCQGAHVMSDGGPHPGAVSVIDFTSNLRP